MTVDAMHVEAVHGGGLAEWIKLPRQVVYSAESPWVAPLDSDLRRLLNPRRNPFFRHGEAQPLLVRDGKGQAVGRILAHVYHRHTVHHGERAGFFGYFECVDDHAAARALIGAAAGWAAKRNCELLRGPFNMTAMQEMGVLVGGFEAAPAVDETYTAPHYPQLFEAAGLRALFPVTTFRVDDVGAIDPEMLVGDRHRAVLADHRLRIRRADMRHFHEEIETLRELLNDSFADNPHFVPITHDEFEFQIGPYRRLMDPEISLVAEFDGVPVGFIVAVPDFNPLLKGFRGRLGPRQLATLLRQRRRIRDAVLIIMGVSRRFQGRGVMRVLHAELFRALQRRRYQRLTITWVADGNARSLATCRAVGGLPLHQLTLFEGSLPLVQEVPW